MKLRNGGLNSTSVYTRLFSAVRVASTTFSKAFSFSQHIYFQKTSTIFLKGVQTNLQHHFYLLAGFVYSKVTLDLGRFFESVCDIQTRQEQNCHHVLSCVQSHIFLVSQDFKNACARRQQASVRIRSSDAISLDSPGTIPASVEVG